MSCPPPNVLSNFYTIDATCVQFLNQIWNQIIQNLEKTSSNRIFAEYLKVFVIGCKSYCKPIHACRASLCDLIATVNTIAPQTNYGFNYNIQLRPILFGLTRKATFEPLADSVYGGLYANPMQYESVNIREIYEKIILNPLGSFVNFESSFKYIETETPTDLKNCPFPGRGYFRIIPLCTKKYEAIVLGVWYLLYSGIPIQINSS